MQEQRIVYLNPRDLLTSKRNVRSDPGDLAGLAETIREHGILQPLGVTRDGDAYRVIYGHRRRDAAIVVGLDRVPCMLLQDVAEDDAAVQQTLENLQRLDLNDMEKARAFETLLTHLVDQGHGQGEAQELTARTLGLSSRQIQRYLRLRGLTPAVQQMIMQGDLGVTQAQHLVDLPLARQEEVAQLAVEESLSAAELARLAAALQRNTNIEAQAALMALRRGERVAIVEQQSREVLQRLNQGAPPEQDGAGVEGPAEQDEDGAQVVDRFPTRTEGAPEGAYADGGPEYATMEPSTRDGNRVYKIHSLDSFADEVQRLVNCVQEGDLQRLLEQDPHGNMKARLVVRQLRFLADAVGALAGVAPASDAAWGAPNPTDTR